jgi:hypothetical protein
MASIVAPCITKLKACMAPLDFNSVRNSWSIAIAVDNEEVTIVHTKKETATPDSEVHHPPPPPPHDTTRYRAATQQQRLRESQKQE